MTVTPSTSTGPNYGTEPFGEQATRHSLPTSAQAGRTNFRTSVIQLDRPGDPSVFSEQTYAEARELMARYPAGQARSALLPMLHLVQSVQGHVTADGIAFCAEQLDLTKAQVTAVATFYTMYKRAPTGEYLVSVCTNTLCGMMGGDAIFAALKDSLGVGNNDTTADGAITLEHAECLAACDYAPVVTVNYEFFDNQSVESATQLVDQLRAGQRPAPTRGAPLCTFRQIERQIAGFFDDAGLAPEATSSGAPTEVGVALALQRGDTAPSYATRKDSTSRPVTPPGAEQARQTSAHDAPLETAQSDDAHEAKPPGGAA
jgi:NADH-quinone oxidoreductase subunit E